MVAQRSTGSDSSCGDGDDGSDVETEVVLNVYDLTPMNNYMYWFGVGIYHSGIEVHGKEYGFGAHEFPISGVFEVQPRKCPGFAYRCSISLGSLKMPSSEFRRFIELTASEYHGDTYHLISKNCNHFTDDISRRLTGQGIPGWVNRLARLGALCSCLLPESLQETTVKQLPEYHECADGSESNSPLTPTPQDSPELEYTDQEKLLSPFSSSGEVSFVNDMPKVN